MTNLDRCDSCSAQAYVRVLFVTGDLLFCGHHFDKSKGSFPENHTIIEDTRKELVSA